MKKIGLFSAIALGVFLSACSGVASAAQGVVDLPDTLEADITALVLVVVSWLIVQLVMLLPFLAFLNDFKVPLAMAVATQLIGLIEGAVPDAYGAIAILVIQVILAAVALFMTAGILKERGVKGFK